MRQKNCYLLQTFKKFLKLICYYLSGQAPTDVVGIIMELLRAVVVLLGVSMFFSIITSVLTASEELRVNFPSGKCLDSTEKGSADLQGDMRSEEKAKTEDPGGRIDIEDIKTGSDEASKEESSISNKLVNDSKERVNEQVQKDGVHQEPGTNDKLTYPGGG